MTKEEMDNIYQQDRFFASCPWEVIWMYHNADASSGDQFVANYFGEELLEEGIQAHGDDPYEVFNYVGECCKQYCSDVGEPWYDGEKERFLSEPIAIGLTQETIDKLKKLMEGN